jgi:prepilin-type N-terminal cleavage/methylation domain-containing protein
VSRRSGFTLIEVLVSIVLTAVVSLLVYGAVQAARETQGRVANERHALQSALAMRLLLEGALAAAQTSYRPEDTVFVLESRVNARGVPQDRVTFVASGDFPPLSPGADWIVTLEPTPEGLRLSGEPRGFRTTSRVLALLPGVTGLGIRVRVPGKDPTWSRDWNFPTALPEAAELTYWSDSGSVGLPLTVWLALGQQVH